MIETERATDSDANSRQKHISSASDCQLLPKSTCGYAVRLQETAQHHACQDTSVQFLWLYYTTQFASSAAEVGRVHPIRECSDQVFECRDPPSIPWLNDESAC